MLDFGFSTVHAVELIGEDEFNYSLPILGGNCDSVTVKNKDAIKYIYTSDTPEITKETRMVRFLTAPVRQGDVVGSVVFKCSGKIIATTDIIATEAVDKAKGNLFDSLF